MSESNTLDFELPESLRWLMDASLFIDRDLIDRYYDAIVRPIHLEGARSIKITDENVSRIAGKLGASATVKPSELWGKILSSFVGVEASVQGQVDANKEDKTLRENVIDLVSIDTPHRRLEQLALHYLVNFTDRIFLEEETKDKNLWIDSILKTPRALAFFNFPSQAEARELDLPETCMIPAAAEFENGEIVPIYQDLMFDRWMPPKYPEMGGVITSLDDLIKARKGYWGEFGENFSATTAMLAVENAAKNRGKIRWIAFRVPLTERGDSLHLHLHPAEQYDTGVFAYNFIKRAYKHGLRIVGSLKSEPDLNVIAIYEK